MKKPKVCHLPRAGLASIMRIYGLTARALRFYEDCGLIEAQRDRQNARYYGPDARRRLDLIAPLRRADVSLLNIKQVLDAEDEAGRGQDYALRAIEQRRGELLEQLARTDDAIKAIRAYSGALPGHAVSASALVQAGASPSAIQHV